MSISMRCSFKYGASLRISSPVDGPQRPIEIAIAGQHHREGVQDKGIVWCSGVCFFCEDQRISGMLGRGGAMRGCSALPR